MNHQPHIAINALSATMGGGLTVARGLCAGLARVRPEWSFLFLYSRPEAAFGLVAPNLKCAQILPHASVARRLAWEQVSMLSYFRSHAVDAAILLGGFAPSASTIPMISVWQNSNIYTSIVAVSSWNLRGYILIQRLLMRISLARADLNVFLSKDSEENCAAMMQLDRDRSAIIAIGIDDRFHRQVNIPDREVRRPIVVTIGDLYRHKRVELVIEAFILLRDELPAHRCVVAGRPVDASYMGELQERVRAAGLEDRIEFRGGIDSEQVLALYRESLVYVTASRLETFGLTPIEAMASGLPVVAAEASALPEIGGDAVLLVKMDSVDAIANGIFRLCSDPAEWRRRRDAGLERSRRFSWDRIATEYAERLERLMEGHPTGLHSETTAQLDQHRG